MIPHISAPLPEVRAALLVAARGGGGVGESTSGSGVEVAFAA